MPHVEHIINKIETLNYRFDRETKRVRIFKNSGRKHRVVVRKKNTFSDKECTNILRQCGCSKEEIIGFLRSSNS